MQVAKPVGRNASALKYDILSALGVHALSGDKHRQRLVLRIITLMTTRYNWRNDELSVGREEIARLWSVNERTVKRDMAKLRAMGWVSVKRPGARGRVTVYGIDIKQILLDTQLAWSLIGRDFVERVSQDQNPDEAVNVVPFQAPSPKPFDNDGSLWSQVQTILHGRDPELWSSWFRHLTETERDGGRVVLTAPSRFMADYIAGQLSARLLAAYGRLDPSIRSIRIEAAPG